MWRALDGVGRGTGTSVGVDTDTEGATVEVVVRRLEHKTKRHGYTHTPRYTALHRLSISQFFTYTVKSSQRNGLVIRTGVF